VWVHSIEIELTWKGIQSESVGTIQRALSDCKCFFDLYLNVGNIILSLIVVGSEL